MAASNGSLKTANGHADGKVNGSALGRRRQPKPGRGLIAWTFGVVARLATWAAILTILFRCPSSLEACDESSPFICQHYFRVKNAVSPHTQPYYDQYAAPYVEIAKPYYQTLDSTVLSPVRDRAIQYGAPWVAKGQEYAVAQWMKNGEPRLVQLQDITRDQYEQTLSPYLGAANEAVGPYYAIARNNALQTYYEFILPGYQFVEPYALQGYDASRDFATGTALPAASWAWNKTYVFLDTTVWPQLRVVYLDNVEPQLVRIGERLGRYKTAAKARTAQEKQAASSASDAAQSSFSKPPTQSTTATSPESSDGSAAAQSTEADGSGDEYWNPVEPPVAADNETEKRKKAREMVAEDLAMWQNKFAAQADEGAADMEERVDEIAKGMIVDHAQTAGKGLVEALEGTVKSAMEDLKLKISSTAERFDGDLARSEDEVVRSVRSAGVTIKEKAQEIRQWREQYDNELQDTVVRAADVHFQILDETRGLALQQIGMKWAWTDGVTYKDWAKYHELKSTLNEWTDQLKQLIVSHPTLLEAQDAAAQVEDEGMEIASEAAKELARLKGVGHYKVLAKDATDNFETEEMKLAAAAAQEAEKAKDTAEEPSEDEAQADDGESYEAAGDASDAAEDQSAAASQGASSILSEGEDVVSKAGEELTGAAGESSTAASSAAEELASDASSLASEGEETLVSLAKDASGALKEDTSIVSDSVSSAFGEASETEAEATSSVSEKATESASSLASAATEFLMGDTEPIADNASEGPVPPVEDEPVEVEEDPLAEREETLPSDTPSVRPAFLGAAAQEVAGDRQPILDNYVDPDAAASATGAASEAYSNAVSKASEQYSSAVSVVSAQIYGTPKPVHEQLFASVSGAYEQALAAASSRFNDAVEAASTGVQGTPTATSNPVIDWQKAEAVASQRLNEGRLWAELQYSSALIAMGLATPTPTAATDKFYEQAKFNYYAGLGLAQDRYASFMSAASSAFSSITATPTPTDYAGSASSMLAAARESAASAANAAGEAAGDAYSAATDTVASAAGAVDESIGAAVDAASEQMYIAGAAVVETWDNVIAEISGRVYGETKQISWYENIVNEAGSYASAATEAVVGGSAATHTASGPAAAASAEAAKQYQAVSQLVSELLVGKEPTFTESVLSRLGNAYSTAASNVENFASEASAAASSVGDKVGSAASQATDAVKESVQRERDEL